MKLKIFGQMIRVLKEHDLTETQGARGLCFQDKKLIFIDSDLTGDEYLQTLLHEVVHAVIQRTGIHESGLTDEVEEIICDNVATAIVENFKIKIKRATPGK